MAAIPVEIRSVLELAGLAHTFAVFPEPVPQQLSIEVVLMGSDSVFGARTMERILLNAMRRYAWTAPRLHNLRSLAHAAEMLGCADEQLARIADHIAAVGWPLRFGESKALFNRLEEIGHVVMHAAADCVPMVKDPSTTLAHKLIYLGKNVRRRFHHFAPHRMLEKVNNYRADIVEIMVLAPPMV